MAMGAVPDAFKRLVKLVARAFYSEDAPSKSASQSKSKVDNRGTAVVVLDALTRRPSGWVKEEDLAKDLKLHPKQLRRTLKVLDEHQLVNRDSRKEVVRAGGVVKEMVVNEDGAEAEEERLQRAKVHTLTYCSLDYPKLYDIVRYRVHRAKKRMRDELEDRKTVQELYCPNASCGRRYTTFDALHLLNPMTGQFECEKCKAEVVAEGENAAAEEQGEGNERRKRRETLKDNLQKMESQLKPLVDALNRVKDLMVPDFGTLHQWEQNRGMRAKPEDNPEFNIQLMSGKGGPGSSSFYGDPTIGVDLSEIAGGAGKQGGGNGAPAAKAAPFFLLDNSAKLKLSEAPDATMKAVVKGEVKIEEPGTSGGPLGPGPAGVKKEEPMEDDKEAEQKRIYQMEYMKAYYAMILGQQAAAGAAGTEAAGPSAGVAPAMAAGVTPVTVKHEEGVEAAPEEDEDIEWEDADMDGEGDVDGQAGANADAGQTATGNMDQWWDTDDVDDKDYDTD